MLSSTFLLSVYIRRKQEESNRKGHHRTRMSGVGFLVKTFTPAGRRRRRCEKQQHKLELPGYGQSQPDVVPYWESAAPITPPAAFLPPEFRRSLFGEIYTRKNISKQKQTIFHFSFIELEHTYLIVLDGRGLL